MLGSLADGTSKTLHCSKVKFATIFDENYVILLRRVKISTRLPNKKNRRLFWLSLRLNVELKREHDDGFTRSIHDPSDLFCFIKRWDVLQKAVYDHVIKNSSWYSISGIRCWSLTVFKIWIIWNFVHTSHTYHYKSCIRMEYEKWQAIWVSIFRRMQWHVALYLFRLLSCSCILFFFSFLGSHSLNRTCTVFVIAFRLKFCKIKSPTWRLRPNSLDSSKVCENFIIKLLFLFLLVPKHRDRI